MISEEFLDRFWGPGGDRDEDDPTKRVVVDGEHYYLCEETGSLRFRGFGGHRFHIEFFDGRRATTTNLMHQGRIPAKYRERFPDNARFVTAAEAAQAEQERQS
ncbi:hypothetical protein [Nonomuraea sp. NPDC050202]|uniref:hypothetical protein n=1 Tax=Nonomuraea sp. NPDC050202 TaxID=3155035 RepID=UPI0033C822C4